MSALPRVAEATRERVSREFDDLGPEVCRTQIVAELEAGNPEILDMAVRCARAVGAEQRALIALCMFYRLLEAESRASLRHVGGSRLALQFNLLPRVTPETRAQIVLRIDLVGSAAFTREMIDEMQTNNPELLQIAHGFASQHVDYLGVMQGFVLLYACLDAQAAPQPARVH